MYNLESNQNLKGNFDNFDTIIIDYSKLLMNLKFNYFVGNRMDYEKGNYKNIFHFCFECNHIQMYFLFFILLQNWS